MLSKSSGAIVTLVPKIVLVMLVYLRIFENPKSAIFATPLWSRIFAVLKSLCKAPIEWSPTNPLSICFKNYRASSYESLFFLLRYSSISFPLQYSVNMNTSFSVEKESMYLITFSFLTRFKTVISLATSYFSFGVSTINFLAITLPKWEDKYTCTLAVSFLVINFIHWGPCSFSE